MISSSSSSSSKDFLRFLLTLPLFLLVSSSVTSAASAPSPPPPDGIVGVTYSMNTPGLPPPKQVADALKAARVSRVLLFDPYPDGIAAFNNTGISLLIAINNTHLPHLAANESEAFRWIGDNIILPNVTVEAIAVGYGVLSRHLDLATYLLPALKNLYRAFSDMGINQQIYISTYNSYDLITPKFPPSAGRFNKSVASSHVMPLLAFLAATNSSLLIDIFPFKLYRSGVVKEVTSNFATFDPEGGGYLTDPRTGLVYDNLFDAMVDAVVGATARLGYRNVPLVVAATGWPSTGGVSEPEASVLFAAEYNERLVSRLNVRVGTPAWPAMTPVTYIYSLFDEPSKDEEDSEGNWGIWTADMQQKYKIDLTAGANNCAPGCGARRQGLLQQQHLLPPCWVLVLLFAIF